MIDCHVCSQFITVNNARRCNRLQPDSMRGVGEKSGLRDSYNVAKVNTYYSSTYLVLQNSSLKSSFYIFTDYAKLALACG